jgi:DNA methylase N-4/N-6
VDGYNDNLNQQQIDKLQQLFPEVVTEGTIDWQKLQATLGEAVDLGERYGLGWKGKSDVFATIQEKTVQTLHPDRANSVDWDTTGNMFIEGDNLAALKILHKAYYGKVKMIYIDPPYNTGSDFIYNDGFKQTRRSYEAEAGITDDEGNVVRDDGLRTNTDGHKHSNWLNMMYPRLFLARNLLCQDGVIFVSIDYNENYNLRTVMNEIFGEYNFLGEIYWESKTKSQNTETSFNKLQPKAEMILVYARNTKRRFNLVVRGEKEYPFEDEQGRYREYPLEVMNANGIRGRQSMVYDVMGITPPAGKQWQLGLNQVASYISTGNLFIRDRKPIIKMRPENERNHTTEPFWGFFDKNMGTAESAKKELTSLLGSHGFETVKPTDVIKRLVYHATEISNADIILDFFSGSGTTAHAVAELNAEDGGNRRWICVQLPELTDDKSEAHRAGYRTIADIARERIRRVDAKIRADQADKLVSRDAPLDLGFRAYRVGDSNFKQWNELVSDPEEIRQQALASLDPLEEGVTDDDLLTELLLKRGISPLAKIEQHDNFCFIPSEKLAICLTYSMTEELFTAILATKPSSIILLDRAFADDINLKVNLLLQAERQGVEVEAV